MNTKLSTYRSKTIPQSPTSDSAAVVVTYNRKKSLVRCTEALLQQSKACDVIIVDNSSSDGTPEVLLSAGYYQNPRINYLRLNKNLGGAGGFRQGMSFAMSSRWNWLWLLDDDGVPEKDALEKLFIFAGKPDWIYGSIAIGESSGKTILSWPALPLHRKQTGLVITPEDLNEPEEVNVLPFIGFLIHRNLVSRIGYPDQRLFISGDDVEYSERAKMHGARIFQVKSSRIRHPVARRKVYRLFGTEIFYRELPPWKIYYEVRNKIIIGKRYHGLRLWTATLPGILIRAILSLFKEKQKVAVGRVYILAVVDGLRGRLGRRPSVHEI